MKSKVIARFIGLRGKDVGGAVLIHDDDSSSHASSHTVGSGVGKTTKQRSNAVQVPVEPVPPVSSQQSVLCFDESCNLYYESPRVLSSDEELCMRWYDAEEIAVMKELFRNEASEMKHAVKDGDCSSEDQACVAIVSHVYHACLASCEQHQGQQNDDGDAAAQALEQELQLLGQHEIREWNAAWVGMEHLLDRNLRHDKRQRREDLVHMVYNLYHKGKQISGTSERLNQELDELLRQQCQQITKPAQFFAVCMAQVRRIEG